jgi:Tol biopolymer transport system component
MVRVFLAPLSVLALGASAEAQKFKLNAPLTGGADVALHRLSPDGSRVVYVVDLDSSTSGADEVYSRLLVPGAPAIRISAPLVQGGYILAGVNFSCSASRAVYVASQDTQGDFELYSAPLDGSSSPVKLNGPVGSLDVIRHAISPDGSRIVFLLGDNPFGNGYEGRGLFSAALDGQSGPLALSQSSTDDIEEDFELTPDGARVVFRVTPFSGSSQFYSVPVDGSQAPVALLVNGIGAFHPYGVSPDGERLVAASVDGVYSAPVSGGSAPTLLSGPFLNGHGVGHPFQPIAPLLLSPDSSRVVFLSDHGTDGVFELYSVPVDGSAPESKLNGPLPAGGDVYQFEISSDSSRVVYRGDQMSDGVFEVFSVPIAGGQALRINEPFVPGGDVGDQVTSSCFLISPDSSRVAYRADQSTDGIFELFSVPIDGGEALRLNDPFPGPSNDVSFGLLAHGGWLVYSADQDVNGMEELYAVAFDGSRGSRQLSGTMVPNGDVDCCLNTSYRPFQISSNGAFVVYQADQDTDQVMELYASRLSPGIRDAGATPR